MQRMVHYRLGGLSLVELLVALAVGLVLTMGVTTLMLNAQRSHAELDKTSRQIENGRAAMQLLTTEIQHAGFYGKFAGQIEPPTDLPDPCDTDLDVLRAGLALPIQGFDGLSSAIPGCVHDAGHVAGTDVLVLRRVETEAPAALQVSEIYLQGAPAGWRLDVGDLDLFPSGVGFVDRAGVAFPIRRYRSDVYFIGDTANGPALRRLELVAGQLRAVTLVDGIENLQLDYGIDRSGDGSPNTILGQSDAYLAAPAAQQWPDVVAVRVNLLARSPKPTAGYRELEQKRFRLGLTAAGQPLVVGPFDDDYRRQAYHGVVRAVNISSRRE